MTTPTSDSRPPRRRAKLGAPTFDLDHPTDPVAAAEPDSAAPASAPPAAQRVSAPPTPAPPADGHVHPEAPDSVDAGPATRPESEASSRVATRVPRLQAELPREVRTRWRNQLRAQAGGYAQALRRAGEQEDAWNDLVTSARAAHVPDAMIVAAMADAGLPVDPEA